MNYYRFPENKGTKLAAYLLMLALILTARDSMITGAMLGVQLSQVLLLAMAGVLGIAFLIVRRKAWKAILSDRRMLLFAISAVVVLVPMVVKRDWQLMYLSVLLCIFFGIFLTYFTTLREVARYYVVVLSGLALYSLLTAYILRIPADMGLWNHPTFINGAGNEFYHFGLSTVPLTFVPHRNFGIFREPGVYQYFIILGLFLNNYELEWDKAWKLWVINVLLAVTMVSTFATGGLVELAIFVVLVFFDKGCYRTRTGRQAAAVVILGGIAVIALSMATKSLLYSGIVENVRKFTVDTESADDRAGSLGVNIAMFLSHPLFGGGLAQTLHAIDNNTSSTTILFAVLGVFGGLFHVLGWVVLVWKKERRVFTWLLLGLILAMAINTQNMIADVFLWIFPMMAMAEKLLPLGQRKG